MKICTVIWRKFLSSPYIRYNSGQTNLLLALSLFAFIIIAIDLETELAAEKNEIGQVITVLENSIEDIFSNNLNIVGLNDECTGSVPINDIALYPAESYLSTKDRSPPSPF